LKEGYGEAVLKPRVWQGESPRAIRAKERSAPIADFSIRLSGEGAFRGLGKTCLDYPIHPIPKKIDLLGNLAEHPSFPDIS
jgi:hypothetical protein